jgi:hypothetical protein
MEYNCDRILVCRYISSCHPQSLEVPVPNLRETPCSYTHEILSTPRKRLAIEGPLAPPPTATSNEALELEPKVEEIPILSQPPPKDDGDLSLILKEEPHMTKE